MRKMTGRTARAIQRLKHSSDFNELMQYFEEELASSQSALVILGDNEQILREQGAARFLTRFLKEVQDSELISQTK